MSQPKANVIIGNGNLGSQAQSEDGTCGLIVSGIAVGGKFALGDVLGPIASLADAEALGIDAAYDATNTCLAHKHISDFYNNAPNGTLLYVMVVAKTVYLTPITLKTNAYAKKLLATANGKIKLLGITLVPDGGYTPTYSGQFEADLASAIVNAKALLLEEEGLYRYCRIILEGRNFQGNASSSVDLTDVAGATANRVGVVMYNDNDFITANSYANKMASVGDYLGLASVLPVQRSTARVKNGPNTITNPGYSNGAAYSSLTDTNRDTLNDHGYVFLKQHVQKAGYYINLDSMAAPLTDDYCTLKRGRVIDKMASIAREIYTNDIEDDIDIDPASGKLPVAVCKAFQGEIETAINQRMVQKGELSAVKAFVNPDQNVFTSGEIVVEVNGVPKGEVKTVTAKIAYKTSV